MYCFDRTDFINNQAFICLDLVQRRFWNAHFRLGCVTKMSPLGGDKFESHGCVRHRQRRQITESDAVVPRMVEIPKNEHFGMKTWNELLNLSDLMYSRFVLELPGKLLNVICLEAFLAVTEQDCTLTSWGMLNNSLYIKKKKKREKETKRFQSFSRMILLNCLMDLTKYVRGFKRFFKRAKPYEASVTMTRYSLSTFSFYGSCPVLMITARNVTQLTDCHSQFVCVCVCDCQLKGTFKFKDLHLIPLWSGFRLLRGRSDFSSSLF